MNMHDTDWDVPPEALKLEDQAIDVWRTELNASDSVLEHYRATLSDDERKRAQTYHYDRDRNRYILRRALLRKLIGSYLDIEPTKVCFEYNDHGKPGICRVSDKQMMFNLSFSNDLALFAFSRTQAMGIDIEKIDASLIEESIVEKFFSASESQALLSLPAEQQSIAFYNCWTRKEAWIKARGKGLSIPLNSFEVSLAPGRPAQLISAGADEGGHENWSMYALTPAPDYSAALAVEGACTPPRLFYLDANDESDIR